MLPRGYRGGFREAIREAATSWATEKFHPQRETLDFLLREIHRVYGDTKRVRSVLDFDDLEAFSIRLLEDKPHLQNEVRQRFEYVLMDEVQDTNPLQWRLLKLIRREGRFFGVGDINQAIYGFRGARPDGFRELREDVKASGGVVDFLRENFRSREEILRAAEALLGRAEGMEPPNLCASRVFAPDSSPAVERFVVPTAEEDPKEILLQREAREVCRRIQEMVSQYLVDTRAGNGRPARYSDIAVLFRTTLRFDEYGREFLRADIPCVMTGGRTLFERQEILDAVSWLRVLANPRDEVSLAAVMRSPFGGIGDEVLLSMRVPEVNLVHSARNSDNPGVRRLMKLLDGQRSVRDHSPPDLLLAQAFDSSGYEDVLDPAARANLRRLLEIVAERHTVAAEPIASLVSFLKEAAAEGEPAAGTSSTTDAVSIMTMHAAKGLEFPIVFLPSLDLAATADSTALVYSSADGLGATWRSGPGRTVRDLAAERFRETAAQHRREEANRLLYVAITRAEQRLIVSSVQDRGGWAPLIASMPVEPVTAPDPVQLGLFV